MNNKQMSQKETLDQRRDNDEEIEYLKATIYYLRKHGFHELASRIAEREKLSE